MLPHAAPPQELIDKIIDHVAASASAVKTLMECALTNRRFRSRSQHHLFHSIIFHEKAKIRRKKVRKLHQILKNNPNIARYIKELHLECAMDMNCSCTWIYQNRDFVKVMSLISTPKSPLRKLTVQAGTWADHGVNTLQLDNAELHPMMTKFFLPFIVPYITSLSLQHVNNIPLEVVTLCRHITSLELIDVDFAKITDPIARAQPFALRHLAHRHSQKALTMLVKSCQDKSNDGSHSVLELSQLRSFYIYTDDLSDLVFEQKIIDVACRTLEELRIVTYDSENTSWDGSFHGIADLQHLTSLRSLSAHVLFPDDSLGSLRKTLATVRPHSLEYLFLEAKVSFTDSPSEPESVLDGDWADLCAKVMRIMVSGGSHFELKVTTRYRDYGDDKITLKDYEALMDARCKVSLDTILREKLYLLQNNPSITFTSSYELEFDALYVPHYD